MHTAVVARDIATFLDAYANSTYSTGVVNATLLNYWGFSYGVSHMCRHPTSQSSFLNSPDVHRTSICEHVS